MSSLHDDRFATHYKAWLRGLTPDQQHRFLQRLFSLQTSSPLTGWLLKQRCAGLKSCIIRGTINNPAWGRSLKRRQWYLLGLRRGKSRSPHIRLRIEHMRLEEEARQRALGYDPEAYRKKE